PRMAYQRDAQDTLRVLLKVWLVRQPPIGLVIIGLDQVLDLLRLPAAVAEQYGIQAGGRAGAARRGVARRRVHHVTHLVGRIERVLKPDLQLLLIEGVFVHVEVVVELAVDAIPDAVFSRGRV